VVAGALLVGTLSGTVHVLDLETGAAVRPPAPAGGPVRHGLLALPKGYVVVTQAGRVQRHTQEGQLEWTFEAGGEVEAPPRLLGGRVVVVTRAGVVLALAP
jgi:outer membrane protein assembly factor BamB